ncbi:fungal-specific transcription factor domain-containing protein [Mycena filopes]|nr:fungal-specific transcription factor domain-containing protein [Mycena filopes]
MGSAPKDKEEKTRKKPGRVPTSCCECRRLKLRCDKNVPCGKCVARGCGSICPDGTLTSGKGNRLVLANTEELHDRIEFLCARIRELEDALRTLQETVTDRPHPLLRTDLLNIKTVTPRVRDTNTSAVNGNGNGNNQSPSAGSGSADSPDASSPRTDDESFIDAFGTLTIGLNGESSFLGQTARSEYLFRALAKLPPTPIVLPHRLSRRILELSTPDVEVFDEDLEREIIEHLPVLSEAMRLCNTYLEHAAYLPMALQRSELVDEVMDSVYRAGGSPSAEGGRNPHALALLFAVFATAAILDPTKHAYSAEAQEYYYLARAALSLTPPERETTRAAIQALIHMAQYVDLSDWEGVSANAAWLHIGMAVRLALGIGLHLDSARWNLSEATSERRNRLLWQLFSHDTWLSFSLGRPPSMSTAFIDVPYPKDEPGSDPKEISYFLWTCKYSVLMHSVMSSAFGCKVPTYNTVLELDRQVRDFYIPVHLRPTCTVEFPSIPPYLQMQRFLALSTKESTLLSLHRAYFAQALQDKPDDLANHRYIPSVMATYRSAWRLIRGLVIMWRDIPGLLSRVGAAWSPALSAAIVMCILVTRAPGSKMTKSSLEELDALTLLFQEASTSCRFAGNLLQAITILTRKAHQAVDATADGYLGCDVTPADLDRLGGRTHLVSQVANADSPPSPPSPQTPSPPTTFRRAPSNAYALSTLPSAMFDATPLPLSAPTGGISGGSGGGSGPDPMHPTIAQDMRSFDLGEPSAFYDTFPDDADMAGIQFHGDSVFSSLGPGVYGHGFGSSSASAAPGGYQHQQAGFGSGGGPMLDATWQSFVEQLGF